MSGITANCCRWCFALLILIGTAMTSEAKWLTIHNDFEIYDADGNAIQTRSGCLRKFGDTYYWYGTAFDFSNQRCYSSKDLLHWTYNGVMITAAQTNRIDVVYNDSTKLYVMILKYVSSKGVDFGVATSTTPTGPFTYKTDNLVFGYQIGDMSVFQDFDGKCYFLYVWDSIPGANSGGISQHAIASMSSNYQSLNKRLWLWNRGSREAPMVMNRHGLYYYLTSLTLWIDPTLTQYYTAPSISGPWTDNLIPTIAPGDVNNVSWDTQCDYVFVFPGTKDTMYMYCGDRWKTPRPTRLGDFVWTPISFTPKDSVVINYYQDWEVEPDLGQWRQIDSTRNLALHKTATALSTSGNNLPANVTVNKTWQNYADTKWISASSDPQWIMIDLGAPMPVNRVIIKWDSAYAKSFKIQVSTDNVKWDTVFSTTKAGQRCITDETFPTTTARYVRMYGTQRGTTGGYSMYQFMVLNDSLTSTGTSFKTSKSVSLAQTFLTCQNKTIHYSVPAGNSVKLDIVDARGKVMAVLVDGFKSAGDYQVSVPGKLCSGIYIVRLTTGAKIIATMQVKL